MTEKTYTQVSLQVFLHCTLGGFAETRETRVDHEIARRYLGGEKVDVIEAALPVSMPTIYRRLRRMNIPLRSAA